MCEINPFKFRWSRAYIHNSSYHHHQIRSINHSQCCHIFPWFCARVGCTIICCGFHIYIYIPGKPKLCFLYYCAVLWCVQMIKYIMAQCSHLFVCTLHYLSSLCRWIRRNWISKIPVRYILPSRCLRLSKFLKYLSCNVWAGAYSVYPFLLWLWELVYFTLTSSSNRKYDPFAIVLG